jgi:hypothetical protein
MTSRPITSKFTGLTLILLFVFSTPVFAEFDWSAKYAGDFISGQSSARLLALGGTGVAIANGPSAVLANPALIGNSGNHAVSFMHADRFESAVKVDHMAYVRKTADDQYVGFGLVRQGVDDIPITKLTQPGQPLGNNNRVISDESTGASEYAFYLSTSRSKSYGTLGASAKLIYKDLYDSYGIGLGIDLGYSRSFGNLVVGAQLRDAITTLVVWDTGHKEVISPVIRAGAAYTIVIERMQTQIMPVAEVQIRTESIDDEDVAAIHAGLEYRIREVVSARIGYDEERLTYGAGLRLGTLGLNYAFVGHDDLGDTHRVSVSFLWGRS